MANPTPNFEKRYNELEEFDLGATGNKTEAPIREDDEGEIKIAITSEDGKVIINFGLPIAWVGMNPDQAIQLSESLKRAAEDCKK